VRSLVCCRIVWQVSHGGAVVGLSGVGWSISFDESTKVADAVQFFYFVLKRLAFIYGVAVVVVILVVYGHICIGGIQGFAWWWDKVCLERFVEHGGLGSLGPNLELDGGLSVLAAEGV